MSTYTNKHSAVVAMLEQARNNHGYNMTDLEEKTGITRSQLYRWINGDAKNIQQKSFQAVAHNLGYVITNAEDGIEVTHHIQTQGEPEMYQQIKDKERIIALQEEKIAILEQQAELVSQQADKDLSAIVHSKQGEHSAWEMIEHDFIVYLDIAKIGFQLKRTIKKVDGLKRMAKHLGYDKSYLESLWDLDNEHLGLNTHPIEQIIDIKSKAQIEKSGSTLPLLFETLKKIIGYHYIPQAVIYIHKNGSRVPSMSYNKINWKEKRLISKVQFLHV